jgi:drug/metabolite transporter (DMT)-like permease
MYFCFTKLPLELNFIIGNIGLVLVTILNSLILKIKMTKNDIIGTFLAFLGVSLVSSSNYIIENLFRKNQ